MTPTSLYERQHQRQLSFTTKLMYHKASWMTVVTVGIIVAPIKDKAQVGTAPLYKLVWWYELTNKYNTRAMLGKRSVGGLHQFT